MSSENRKIGYYNLELTEKEQSVRFNYKLLDDFLSYLSSLPKIERLDDNPATKKAIMLSDCHKRIQNDIIRYEIVFYSCKHHHCVELLSITDATTTPTTKKPEQGELEKTHLSIAYKENDDEDAIMILEERQKWVSSKAVRDYLNKFLKDFISNQEDKTQYRISITPLPSEKLLDFIKKPTSKIKYAQIQADADIIENESFGNFVRTINGLQQDIFLELKAERGAFFKLQEKWNYLKDALTTKKIIKRIKIKGIDSEGMEVILDTLGHKKRDYIKVELDGNGVVITTSIFRALKELLFEFYERENIK